MPDGHERRRYPRFRIEAFVALEARGMLTRNNQAFGPVIDISRSGMRIRTSQPPTVGQFVILRVAIGEEISSLRATTARVAEVGPNLYDVGLDFSWCNAEEIEFLDRCIEMVSSRAG